MSSNIQGIITDFIAEKYEVDRNMIDDNTNLVDQGVIDSFAYVEIATFLEKEYKIKISNEDINSQNFSTIQSIALFMQTRID